MLGSWRYAEGNTGTVDSNVIENAPVPNGVLGPPTDTRSLLRCEAMRREVSAQLKRGANQNADVNDKLQTKMRTSTTSCKPKCGRQRQVANQNADVNDKLQIVRHVENTRRWRLKYAGEMNRSIPNTGLCAYMPIPPPPPPPAPPPARPVHAMCPRHQVRVCGVNLTSWVRPLWTRWSCLWSIARTH
jgi:hypothetical protein